MAHAPCGFVLRFWPWPSWAQVASDGNGVPGVGVCTPARGMHMDPHHGPHVHNPHVRNALWGLERLGLDQL